MRALRKIIFINSAHIRYAEVKVDGNVHFIGTQGVGKSTLLRAILFFYNADKLHLGIPREMKPFDEFYLPHANSYIAYEVEHEHGVYSILVNRSSYGRASYRFIDSPFSREWLIDEEGDVTADQKTLNSRLGKLPWKRVEDYTKYRDIIYGNLRESGWEFARYQLIEARRYQNIYRSIQNVFLNSRLDADFIKDIIIRSMNDEEANVNLAYYRNQVSDFEQEYRDISCWYRTDKQGQSAVRIQADAVRNAYHDLLYLKEQIVSLCGEYNYAHRAAEEQIPLIDNKIDRISQERDRQVRLLAEVKDKYSADRSRLDQNIGAIEKDLQRSREKREFYADRHIESVLQRHEQESMLKAQLQAQQRRLSELTAKYTDITAKYKALAEGVEAEYKAYRQTQNDRLLNSERNALADKERIAGVRERQRDDIEAMFDDRLSASAAVIDVLKSQLTECDKKLIALQNFNPYADEIEEVKTQLRQLDGKDEMLKVQEQSLTAEIEKLILECEGHEGRISSAAQRDIERRKSLVNDCENEIADIDRMLAKTDGSLYQWLEDHHRGWEQNIGKIIDEQQVLYQTGLKPRKAASDASALYGVELDLGDLPLTVRRPDELKARRAELLASLSKIQEECIAIEKRRDADIEALRKKYAPKIKGLKDRRGVGEVERGVIPNKRKALKVKLNELTERTQAEKDARRDALICEQQEAAHGLQTANDERTKIIDDKSRRLKAAQKTYESEKTKIEAELKNLAAQIEAQNADKEAQKSAQLRQLRQQEIDELAGKGADPKAVSDCTTQIEKTSAALQEIDKNRQIVFNYLKDKEELFDREDDFRATLKMLREKRERLDEKYALRQKTYEDKISKCKSDISELGAALKALKEAIDASDKFASDPELCPPMLLDIREKKTISGLAEVVEQLKKTIYSRQSRFNRFKEAVNVFKSNFSAKNTFNFRTVLQSNDDYMDFASNLDDFVQNDKIEYYRTRVNDRYIEILSRVSKEMGDLTSYESEIHRIVNDINDDFQQKNFVGVIKLIALRMRESADHIVQLMKQIKLFHDENRDNLGAVTLFSTEHREEVNRKAVDYILAFMKALNENAQRTQLTLSDLFQLEFRVVENDNDTGWVSKLRHVGSEGTDTLVKAMVNIMLINVFKEKVTKKSADFQVHCMMDEIGKLHPQNVKGILEFANTRNILLVNSSPTTYNVSDYRYTYLLDKDTRANTIVHPLISQS